MANSSATVSVIRRITHVVFDMDGLLLDTEKFYTQVQELILARFNKTFDWSLKAKMMGKKAIEAARVFVEETGISDSLSAEQFLVEREEMLRTLFPTSELMPDIMNSKPSLDGFLAAAKRFEGGPVDPCNILVFEDAPSGVLAAKNAGMSVVMVPDPRLDKSFHEAADQVLNSLLDFNPSEWGLPPFEDNGS
uniref:GS1-like protein n=1 Tax=Cajanus cajan TaxID=3821 RepID=A0A151SRL8_CAJCA|nr:GS1-like protein [Cajanus cajan]